MNTTFMSVLAVGTLALVGCGDDDGGGLSDDQQAAVDQLVDSAEEEGIEVDQGCVEDLAADLSEEDAAAIVEAGPDGNAELSEEGEAVTGQLLSCIDEEAIIDLFIQGIEEAGQEVDDDCVREALQGADLATLLEGEEPPADVVEALLGCVEL